MQTRIQLLSGPRNISTAMMYSFAQRNDTTVVDEPLYAYYLNKTGLNHPGREEILLSQRTNGRQVVDEVMMKEYETPVVFFKQMTHHIIGLDLSFLQHSKNIILLRDPKKVLLSYQKVITQPDLEDIGIKQSFDLYQYLHKNGFHYFIIDADDILKDTETSLKNICNQCEIKFDKKMMHWTSGARKEDGIWAKHWYANVHRSTGFEAYTEREIVLQPHLNQIYLEAKTYYEALKNILK